MKYKIFNPAQLWVLNSYLCRSENDKVKQNVDPQEYLLLMILRDDNVYNNNTGTRQKV